MTADKRILRLKLHTAECHPELLYNWAHLETFKSNVVTTIMHLNPMNNCCTPVILMLYTACVTGGMAHDISVGGVFCLVNFSCERDLNLVNMYMQIWLHGQCPKAICFA